MSDWPEYETRKRVRAKQIVWFETNERAQRHAAVLRSDGDEKEMFVPTEPAMLGSVEVGDYAITYSNGWRSVNTKANFEATAVPVSDAEPRFVWCAVRTMHADVAVDTLRVSVTTEIRAFTTEADAAAWLGVQPLARGWTLVQTMLDPPIEGVG